MNSRLLFAGMELREIVSSNNFGARHRGYMPAAQRLSGRRIFWLILSGFFVVFWQICAARAEPYSHFGLCVAPTPPSCAHASLKKKRQRDECMKIANSYVSLVFAYRACLSAEMERAVREANETLRILKCPDSKSVCFTPSEAETFGGVPPAASPRAE